ncbi:plasmid SOS inhibition protein A [Vibrio mediterranei]|uniref:Uncharacterized protein n=1 Tax=Vibrio mediterranei TaxID=689 RepID=A0ABX5D6A0_9VIBR|nr:plasmid SOS inhibition protein A [Vibrio mediterranei]MCG9659929.1 plasmid SOS inhibition protein A [Vibrio mediterranei]PRQ65134.1 hypothetical protein COR51_23725 [Vibrio mediterranei]
MQYPIVLANRERHAILHASINPNKRATYPYASSFFKFLFGTTRPQQWCLSSYGYNKVSHNQYSCTREELNHALNELIKSEGKKVLHPLGQGERNFLYPHLKHAEEQRFSHRSAAKHHVSAKLSDREHKALENAALEELMASPGDALVDWVYKHEGTLCEITLRQGLRLYFNQHLTLDYSFEELYPKELNWPNWRIASAINCEINH